MLSSGMKMILSGMKCYHLGCNVIIWYYSNVIIWSLCYHLGRNVIIWDKMLSSGANVIMVSSGANVIIWCYHVILSSGMITHPFFIFPENFTHSAKYASIVQNAFIHVYTVLHNYKFDNLQ
jgi:hypothetical protein